MDRLMANWLRNWCEKFATHQSGATAIEYGLIAAMISVVIIGVLLALNSSMTEMYEHIRSVIQPALENTY